LDAETNVPKNPAIDVTHLADEGFIFRDVASGQTVFVPSKIESLDAAERAWKLHK
jgi:hypothetical protein